MKLNILIVGSIFFSGCLFAKEPMLKNKIILKDVLSISSYFSVVDESWSKIMAQAQLSVIPTQSYSNIAYIQVTQVFSQDGSCSGVFADSCNIGAAGFPTVLMSGHTYRTTDASNYSFFNNCGSFGFSTDQQYQLLDSDMNPIGNAGCTAGGSGACSSSSNCGWDSPQIWSP